MGKNLLLFGNAEHAGVLFIINDEKRRTAKLMIYASRYDLRDRVFDRLLEIIFLVVSNAHSINIDHRTARLNFHVYFPYGGQKMFICRTVQISITVN